MSIKSLTWFSNLKTIISLCLPCYCKDRDIDSGYLFFYGFMWIQANAWMLLSVCRTSRGEMPHVLFGSEPVLVIMLTSNTKIYTTINSVTTVL